MDRPDDLGAAGVALWTAAEAAPWLVGELDEGNVELVAHLADECARYREMVGKAPLLKEPIVTPTGRVVGTRLVPNPAERMLRRAEAELADWLDALGLTVAARVRLGVVGLLAEEEIDHLDDLTARRAARLVGGSGAAL